MSRRGEPCASRRVLLFLVVASVPFLWSLEAVAPDGRVFGPPARRSPQSPPASARPRVPHSGSTSANASTVAPTAFLGVVTNAADSAIRGVLPGSPAAEAGLRTGDVILEVAGRPVQAGADLQVGLRGYRAGDEIAVRLVRENRPLDVRLILGAGGHRR